MSGNPEQKKERGIANMSISEVEVIMKKLEAENMHLRRELLSARQKHADEDNTIADKDLIIADRDLTIKALNDKQKRIKQEMLKMVQTTLDLTENFQRGQCTAVDSALMLIFVESPSGSGSKSSSSSSPAQQQQQQQQQQQLQIQRAAPPPQSMEQQQQPPSSGPGGWQDNNHVMSNNRGGFNGNCNSPSHGGGRPHFNGGGFVVNPLHAMRHGHGHNMNPCEGQGGGNRYVEMQSRFPIPNNPWPPFPDSAAHQQFAYGHRRGQMQLARRGRGGGGGGIPPQFRYNNSPYHEEWRSRHHNGGGGMPSGMEGNGECGMVYIKQEPIDPSPSSDDGGSIFPF